MSLPGTPLTPAAGGEERKMEEVAGQVADKILIRLREEHDLAKVG